MSIGELCDYLGVFITIEHSYVGMQEFHQAIVRNKGTLQEYFRSSKMQIVEERLQRMKSLQTEPYYQGRRYDD